MTRVPDMTGQRFGRLVVVGFADRDSYNKTRWHCQCDCGRSTISGRSDLIAGKSTTCGCSRIERPPNTRHGERYSTAYASWCAMWTRCTNQRVHNFERYGGRGITICERWSSFENFLADMGPRPEGKSLDRWPDPYGDYKPGNCRWATPLEQRHNRRK